MIVNIAIAIGLLIIGLMLIVIECMIPSFGIIGFSGLLCLAGSVIMGFQSGAVGGFIFIVLALAGIPFAWWGGFKLLPKMPFGRNFILTGPADSRDQTIDSGYDDLEGKEGVTRSVLRPSGVAVINSKRVTVQSEGGMIEKGKRIKVVKVVGNKIFVSEV